MIGEQFWDDETSTSAMVTTISVNQCTTTRAIINTVSNVFAKGINDGVKKEETAYEWPSVADLMDSPQKRLALRRANTPGYNNSTYLRSPVEKNDFLNASPLKTPTKMPYDLESPQVSPSSLIHISPNNVSFTVKMTCLEGGGGSMPKLHYPIDGVAFRFRGEKWGERKEATELTSREFLQNSTPIQMTDENIWPTTMTPPKRKKRDIECNLNSLNSLTRDNSMLEDSGFSQAFTSSYSNTHNFSDAGHLEELFPSMHVNDGISPYLRDVFGSDFLDTNFFTNDTNDSLFDCPSRPLNTTMPLSPCKTLNISPPLARPPRRTILDTSKFDDRSMIRKSETTMCVRKPEPFAHFYPPHKRPEAFSPLWYQIVSGATSYQTELTHKARKFAEDNPHLRKI